MLFIVRSNKLKMEVFFRDEDKAMDLYFLLKSKNSELISDLEMVGRLFSDGNDIENIATQFYQRIYEEK